MRKCYCGEVENQWSLSRGLWMLRSHVFSRRSTLKPLELVEGGVCSSLKWESLRFK
ncbi:hypothetical protein A2U01_0071463, partial [Trifolium medium]|nr:hypothetical protein [Trifolium medium]